RSLHDALPILTKMTKVKTYLFLLSIILITSSCSKPQTAEDIVVRAIEQAGGKYYNHKKISFDFRDHTYVSCRQDGMYALKRITQDTTKIVDIRSEEHTSELQSRENLVCRLLLEK